MKAIRKYKPEVIAKDILSVQRMPKEVGEAIKIIDRYQMEQLRKKI